MKLSVLLLTRRKNRLKKGILPQESTKKKFLLENNELNSVATELKDNGLSIALKEKQIQREVDSLEKNFILLSNKHEEIRIAETEITSDIRFISHATIPNIPVWPNRRKILIFSFIASLVFGMIVALFKEYLDNLK